MKFKGVDIVGMSLKELQAADWELVGVEENYLEALKHPKFEKMKPKPEMNDSFKALRNGIKQEMKKRKEDG